MFVDQPLHGIAAEPPSDAGGEQWLVAVSGTFAQPDLQDRFGFSGQGDGSVFAALALAPDAGAGSQGEIAAVESGELGDPQPGLDREQQQRPVASPFPACKVRGGDQRVGLLGGKKRHDRLVVPLGGDRQHLLDQRGVLGVAQRRVGEQRPDRGQPQVAGPGAVATLGLEMVQERADRFGGQVLPVQRRRRFAGSRLHEHDEHPQRVPVGGDGARAGVALVGQPVGEEALQGGGDQAHHAITPRESSSRPAASASNSGAADRYQ